MVYKIPDNIIEWLREGCDEECDYDPDTHICKSLQDLLKWIVNPESPAPIDALDCVIVYYREDAYEDWVDADRPRDLGPALRALEYLTSIIDCEVPDTLSPNLYYPSQGPPDFQAPATVHEFLALRAAQLGSTPNYEAEVLHAGSQYIAVRITKRRGPLYWCFDNAAYMAQRYGLVYVEGFALMRGFTWPVHHAWNVDRHNRVIDITWQDRGVDYYGVATPTRSMAVYR